MLLLNKTTQTRALAKIIIAFGLALLTSQLRAKEVETDESPGLPEVKWDTTIKKFQFDSEKFVGQRLTVKCPPAPAKQSFDGVFGTDAYPSDCSICMAALHAGVITKNGGTVTIQLSPGVDSYQGSFRHGVRSGDRPKTPRSMTFVTAKNLKTNDKTRIEHIPRITWDTKFTSTGFAHRHLIGQRFTFRCPPMPADLKPRVVYGTDSYAFSSMICRAALHAGKLSNDGVIVTVQIDPGVTNLVGSIRNGVATKSKRGSDRSISFVESSVPKLPSKSASQTALAE